MATQRVLQYCPTFTHSHTQAVRVRHLAQGHLDTARRSWGLNQQPSGYQPTLSISWATWCPGKKNKLLNSSILQMLRIRKKFKQSKKTKWNIVILKIWVGVNRYNEQWHMNVIPCMFVPSASSGPLSRLGSWSNCRRQRSASHLWCGSDTSPKQPPV